MRCCLPIVSAGLLFCGALPPAMVRAQTPVVVPNASFETPDVPSDFGSSTSIPDWTVTASNGGQAVTFDPGANQFANSSTNTTPLPSPAAGFQTAFLTGNIAFSLVSLLSSSLGVTEAGTRYDLSVALGNDLNSFSTARPGLVTIEFLAGGTPLGSLTTNAPALADGAFTDLSTFFVAASSGQDLRVRLTQTGVGQAYLDNVRVNATATPAPPALLVAGIGGGLLGASRMRRKRRGV